MKDNALVQFAILVLAVSAGQIALKFAGGFLPETGIPGSLKSIIAKL